MKNLKTKTCANSVCDNSFKLKSDEKKYCCLSCKNQANYKNISTQHEHNEVKVCWMLVCFDL